MYVRAYPWNSSFEMWREMGILEPHFELLWSCSRIYMADAGRTEDMAVNFVSFGLSGKSC